MARHNFTRVAGAIVMSVGLTACATSQTAPEPNGGRAQSGQSTVGEPSREPTNAAIDVTSQGIILAGVDGGRPSITTLPLPTGVSVDAVQDVVSIGTSTLLAVSNTPSEISVYRSTDGDWSRSAVKLSWPADLPLGTSAAGAYFADSSGDTVEVVATQMLGHATAINELLTSKDDGATFTTQAYPRVSDLNIPWDGMATIGNAGLLVAGSAYDQAFASGDDGATWQLVDVKLGADINDRPFLAAPIVRSGELELPVFTQHADGGTYVSFAKLNEDGTAADDFVAPREVSDEQEAGGFPLGQYADSVWIVTSNSKTIEKLNGDNTWSTVRPSGLPSGVTGVFPTSDTAAVVTVNNSSCTDEKVCTNKASNYATADGGATWSLVQ